jgi:hypothetical protein
MFPSPHPSLPPLPLNKPPQVAMLFLRRRCCSGHRAPDPHSLVLDSRRACLLVASPLRPMMQGRSISRWQPKPVDTRGGGSALHPAALFALSMATAMLFPWVRCHSCGVVYGSHRQGLAFSEVTCRRRGFVPLLQICVPSPTLDLDRAHLHARRRHHLRLYLSRRRASRSGPRSTLTTDASPPFRR